MIEVVKGNLLEAEEDILVHQVNCQSKMASGVALAIRKKYPIVYNDYMEFCNKHSKKEDLLGKVLVSKVEEDKFVANLFGQLNYGYDGKRYTSYDALYEGLSYIKEKAQQSNKSVAMPFKIGSDRGGASWYVVYAMIEDIFL